MHCFKRAERAVATTDAECQVKSELLLEFMGLYSQMHSKAREYTRACQLAASPLEISAILSSTTLSSSESDSDSDVRQTAPAVASTSTAASAPSLSLK